MNSLLRAHRHRALTPDAPLILWNWDSEDVEKTGPEAEEKRGRIQEVEECPEGTVKSRLHHGIKALRRRLNPPSFQKTECA